MKLEELVRLSEDQVEDEYERVREFRRALKDITTTKVLSGNTLYQYVQTPKGQTTFLAQPMQIFKDKPGAHIHWLIAKDRGAGREALQKIVDVADEHQMYLEGYITPLDGGTFKPTVEQLKKFYESFGFKTSMTAEKKPELVMLRPPKAS